MGKEDTRKRYTLLELGSRSPLRKGEEGRVEQGQEEPYSSRAVVEESEVVGTFAYIACRCMAIWQKLQRRRQPCCA